MRSTACLGLAICAALAGGAAHGQPAPEVPPCATPGPAQVPLIYPSTERLPDGRVMFRLCAPDAQSVRAMAQGAGGIPSGFDGQPAGLVLGKDAKGYWSGITPQAVAPGVYPYRFRVGGADFADPQSTATVLNWIGVESLLTVPGPATAFHSYRPGIDHGLVSTIEYPSATMNGLRRAFAYTPPGYEKGGNQRYPVLYLVHGASGNHEDWVRRGNANYILDNLIAEGRAKPMIIVMPFGHGVEDIAKMRNINEAFNEDLIRDLIPFVDRHFRTVADAGHRSMAGLSMGGAHTLNAGVPRPDLFGSVGIFSMGLYNPAYVGEYARNFSDGLKARARQGGLVYYAMGTEDFLYGSVAPTRKVLEDAGIMITYRETPGTHDWSVWREYLHDFAPRLFR